MSRHSVFAAGFALAQTVAGCSDPDCPELCGEAQEADCVWVSGDCERFCSSLRQLADKVGCAPQADDYESCLVDGEICEVATRCTAAEQAYLACVTEFCAAQPTDADCLVVEAAW